MIKITLIQEELEKEIRQAFVYGQGNRALMEVGLEKTNPHVPNPHG